MVVSVTKATRVSTAIDNRSLQAAGGTTVDEGSVTYQREENLSATVNQTIPDQLVT